MVRCADSTFLAFLDCDHISLTTALLIHSLSSKGPPTQRRDDGKLQSSFAVLPRRRFDALAVQTYTQLVQSLW